MSWLSSPDGILQGGWLSSAYSGHGILGNNISSVGDDGGSPVLNDDISPTREYRWELVTGVSAGSLNLYEDLTFDYTRSTDGSDAFTYRLYEDGVPQGTATVSLQVGQYAITITATTSNSVGSIESLSKSTCIINSTTGDVISSVFTSGSSSVIIQAITEAISASISTKPKPVTNVAAVTSNCIGNLTDAIVSISSISATTSETTATIISVGYVNSGNALTQADIPAIVAAVLAALNATTIPVDVKKMNSAPVLGSGTELDKWRGNV